MSFRSRLIHTVTIYNKVAGAADPRYGDVTESYDAGVQATALVQALTVGGQGRETLADMDRRITLYTVFLQADANVNGTSVIVWEGHRLSVFGEPAVVYDGTSSHHIELTAEEVLGG